MRIKTCINRDGNTAVNGKMCQRCSDEWARHDEDVRANPFCYRCSMRRADKQISEGYAHPVCADCDVFLRTGVGWNHARARHVDKLV